MKNKLTLGTVTLLTAFTLSTAMTTSLAYAETVDTITMTSEFGSYNVPINIPSDKILMISGGNIMVQPKSNFLDENGNLDETAGFYKLVDGHILLANPSIPSVYEGSYANYQEYLRLREEALKFDATPSETPKEDTSSSSTVTSNNGSESSVTTQSTNTVSVVQPSTSTLTETLQDGSNGEAAVSSTTSELAAGSSSKTETASATTSSPASAVKVLPVTGVKSGLLPAILGATILSGFGLYTFKKRTN